MLTIRIDVERIDYERSFEILIPQLIETISGKTDLTEGEKLLVRLGDDVVPLTRKLLGYLDEETRDQIIVHMLEMYPKEFIEIANESLEEVFADKVIVIGDLSGEDLPGPKMTLRASQVSIDYEKLINSPVLGTGILSSAAKIAIQMASPATIEKKGISLLSSDLVRPKFVSILSESLQEAGLIMTIGDVELRDDPAIRLPGREVKDEGLLPDAVEDQIIDAIVAWLRDSL